jgi:hypothetical protein
LKKPNIPQTDPEKHIRLLSELRYKIKFHQIMTDRKRREKVEEEELAKLEHVIFNNVNNAIVNQQRRTEKQEDVRPERCVSSGSKKTEARIVFPPKSLATKTNITESKNLERLPNSAAKLHETESVGRAAVNELAKQESRMTVHTKPTLKGVNQSITTSDRLLTKMTKWFRT